MRTHLAQTSKLLISTLFVMMVFAMIPAPVSAASTPFGNSLCTFIPNAEKTMGHKDLNVGGACEGVIEFATMLTANDPSGATYNQQKAVLGLTGSGVPKAEALKIVGLDENSSTGVGGFLLNVTSGILEQRPSSGVVFALDQFDKLTSPDTAYAAEAYFPGTGYALLSPIQSFWGWAATMSFSFMTLIIIAVAFAMIFRSRLGGKQVVQIQNAIPGIVLAMVLIPLSYPLSGLFIDGITLSTNIVHDFILNPGGPGHSVYINTAEGTVGSDGKPFNDGRALYGDDWRISSLRVREQFGALPIATGITKSFCLASTPTPGTTDTTSNCDSISLNQFNLVDSIVGAFSNNQGLANLIGNIMNLVFNIIAIVVSIKITWRLLKKFVMMIFLPITSPFIFATIAIPGRGTAAMFDYFKQMANCALHFIVTYALFLVVIVFANPAYQSTITDPAGAAGYRPPVLAGWLSSIFAPTGGVQSSLIFTVIALGLFLSIPSILDQIDEKLKTAPLPFLKGIASELRSSSDIAFRQAPAVVGSLGRSAITGVRGAAGIYSGTRGRIDSVRNSFRPAGATTVEQERQAKGAARLVAAESQLTDALAKPNNTLAVIRARANLAAARAGTAVLGQTPKTSADSSQKIEVKFKYEGREVDAVRLNNTIMDGNPSQIRGIEIEIKSSSYPLPQTNVQFGEVDNGAFKGTKLTLDSKSQLFTFEADAFGTLATLIVDPSTPADKLKPGANSTSFTVKCILRIDKLSELKALDRGTKLENKPGKLLFDIGGARGTVSLGVIRIA